MLKKIVVVLIFIFLIAPVLTAFHELGHAVIPTLKGEEVMVIVGQNSILNFQIKNLNIEFGLSKPWIGYTSWSGDSTIMQLLLGPLVSLMLVVCFYFIALRIRGSKGLVMACSGWCIFQFLFTILPVNYPTFLEYVKDQQSDGKQIIGLFTKSYNAKQ